MTQMIRQSLIVSIQLILSVRASPRQQKPQHCPYSASPCVSLARGDQPGCCSINYDWEDLWPAGKLGLSSFIRCDWGPSRVFSFLRFRKETFSPTAAPRGWMTAAMSVGTPKGLSGPTGGYLIVLSRAIGWGFSRQTAPRTEA